MSFKQKDEPGLKLAKHNEKTKNTLQTTKFNTHIKFRVAVWIYTFSIESEQFLICWGLN